MDSTIARVGSVALNELKTDLTELSKTLHQIYELMQADMRQVNAAWQDGKYQEFVQNYQPQIQKCDEISNRYAEWCARVLDPTIENVTAVETTDVGNGDGSVGGWNSTAAIGGGMAAAGVAGAAGKFFSSGANQELRPTTKVRESRIPTPSRKEFFDAFAKNCVDEDGNVDTGTDCGFNAIDNLYGKKPKRDFETMSAEDYGYQEGDRIVLNKDLTDDEKINTYGHEMQHVFQGARCEIGENSRNPICVNREHYITSSCNDDEKQKYGEESEYCREGKYKLYESQPMEVNANEAGAKAEDAWRDFKRKFIKPKAYRQ